MILRTYTRYPELSGYRPEPRRLREAGVLDAWSTRPARTGDGSTLVGKDADGRAVETSELLVLDASAGWARTHTGLWRLGSPALPFSAAGEPAAHAGRLQQVRDALLDRDAIEAGWRPSDADLDRAPVISAWDYEIESDGTRSLVGMLIGHPRLGSKPGRTSPLTAVHFDGRDGFARTWSRLYVLGTRADGLPQAEFWRATTRPEAVERAFELNYRAPPLALEPTGDLYDAGATGWSELLTYYERLHGEAGGHHLQCYVALRRGWTPQQAYEHTASWLQSRWDSGYN